MYFWWGSYNSREVNGRASTVVISLKKSLIFIYEIVSYKNILHVYQCPCSQLPPWEAERRDRNSHIELTRYPILLPLRTKQSTKSPVTLSCKRKDGFQKAESSFIFLSPVVGRLNCVAPQLSCYKNTPHACAITKSKYTFENNNIGMQ